MGHHTNIIELNGKRYNATTGRQLESNSKPDKPLRPVVPRTQPEPGLAIDGFVHASSQKKLRSHRKAPHNSAHRTEHSQTLMRHAVKKPSSELRPKAVSGAVDESFHPKTHALPPAPSSRLRRATTIAKSGLIRKFSGPGHNVSKRHKPLAVHQPPDSLEAIQPLAVQAIKPEPFSGALAKAKSHEQPQVASSKLRHRTARRFGVSTRIVGIGAALLAALIIGGFFAFQNIPNLAMRVAAARAGIHASLPGYQPSGFSVRGPIKYSPGQVSVSFATNTDQRNYEVIQKTSDWNSEALLDNFVTTDHRAYQTYQSQGKTIYIYSGSNATWVTGGIWYQVQGSSSLSSDQLLKIANSM